MNKLFISENDISKLAESILTSNELLLLHFCINNEDLLKTEELLENDKDVKMYYINDSKNTDIKHIRILTSSQTTLLYLGKKLGAS